METFETGLMLIPSKSSMIVLESFLGAYDNFNHGANVMNQSPRSPSHQHFDDDAANGLSTIPQMVGLWHWGFPH